MELITCPRYYLDHSARRFDIPARESYNPPMTKPKLGPRRPSRVVRILLGAAIGFVLGGLVGLLFGWVQTNGTHGPIQLVALLKAWAAGATSGTTLGAAVGMLTGRVEPGKSGRD
jgi:hypothetical protein